jgi:starch synthase
LAVTGYTDTIKIKNPIVIETRTPMEKALERSIASSLCRFRVEDEDLITDAKVKAEIAQAFREKRCFGFYPDRDTVSRIKDGDPVEIFRERFLDMLNRIFDSEADGDQTIRNRLASDTRLISRIILALAFFHRAVAEGQFTSIYDRRIVLIKERAGMPTLYHISRESTVISHVGQGPPWTEIPTIYLGLNIFFALTAEQKKGGNDLFEAFKLLLMVEERTIETGYVHEVAFPPQVSRALVFLVEQVIDSTVMEEIEWIAPEVKPVKKFTDANRKNLLRDLDTRVHDDELNFDYEKNLHAVTTLERLARRYKNSDDRKTLHEVMRLLVAASGHDIHEVRNKANMLIERILSPKEFDAPLATKFINISIGDSYLFTFRNLDSKIKGYYLRIYKNRSGAELTLEKEITFDEVRLKYDEADNLFRCKFAFKEYGHYDFAVIRKKTKNMEWIHDPGCNGRVNVIPDVRGEIILEIFTDIHGHTKVYWRNNDGHPGLLYNENGEVIRLGNLSDVTAHLEDIKSRYYITAIYLLGTQKRGNNREDWAPEASSPSPFSPMSLIEIEPSLGGEQSFKKLVSRAHELNIKIIVDIVPHINRRSDHLPDSFVVKTYDNEGNVVMRSSTDGKYGSWNDGKLLNYRKFEIWEWLTRSITTLIDNFDIDGIRFDSAHAVPIMMKKNNYLYTYDVKRTHEEMVEGDIIVNDREHGHHITTGYYDSACRDQISVPLHYYIMLNVERKLRERNKNYFINIAECYWGHERFLTRTGLIPYNSSLFKICENIVQGKTDVREIYHIYDTYYPAVLPEGTELLGILGNHDERRALNTFGHRGLRATVALTSFMHNIIMDYEGSAEGESWKVFLDNIFVNWNQFEYASHRSVDPFYREWYRFHRSARGKGHLIWANNNQVAAAMKFTGDIVWIGAFNFSDVSQNISLQFDNPTLPIPGDACYRLVDVIFSETTGRYGYYRGDELKISRINTVVSYTDRVKLFRLEKVSIEEHYLDFLRDSFIRLCTLAAVDSIRSNFAFSEIMSHCGSYDDAEEFIKNKLSPLFSDNYENLLLGLKRAVYHLYRNNLVDGRVLFNYARKFEHSKNTVLKDLGEKLIRFNRRGPLVFMSAEADPFSKSGGLASVVYELPRELAQLGEDVHVITGLYRHGSDKERHRMNEAVKKHGITYTGVNVRFYIMDRPCEVGVHHGIVDGIHYYLLEHYEFFDGLYWGFTAEEKLRRRVAFARSCAEVISVFNLDPHYTFTNDAYIGLFNGIVKCDPYYANSEHFRRNTFLHIVHNGGWQYFDAYNRHERDFDLFNLFNLPAWRAHEFCDPVFRDRINCMATGIRFADRTITVSPSYARQIEYACDGMERILNNVIGISNAIGRDFKNTIIQRYNSSNFIEHNYMKLVDHIRENAALQEKIETRYPEILKSAYGVDSIEDPTRNAIVKRIRNKLLLQAERGLVVDPDIILFTMIHRISEQKGFQLLLEASEGVFRNLGYQAIIGGAVSSGDRRGDEIAHGLYLLGQYYPGNVNVNFGFQDVAIPLLASDLFCMPSMHEPGGISQLEAFATGCLVVARATGGLRDTVLPILTQGNRVKGNGFLFSDYHSWAFYDAMQRAAAFFRDSSEETVHAARMNAENSVYYWDRPAKQYVQTIYDLTETIRIFDIDNIPGS